MGRPGPGHWGGLGVGQLLGGRRWLGKLWLLIRIVVMYNNLLLGCWGVGAPGQIIHTRLSVTFWIIGSLSQ